jgi:hypothetical protein
MIECHYSSYKDGNKSTRLLRNVCARIRGMSEKENTITLKNDYLFKRLLGAEENKPILQNFIECVLNIPHEEIEGIELLDKELKKDQLDDKTGILDVKVRLKDKTVIDIEIQALWDDSFVNRTLFYWAKIYIEEFKSGEDYIELHKCITINIVGKGFNLSNKVHSKYILKEQDSNELLTDVIEIHFLNLEKARELRDISNPLIRWLLFIDTNSKEERSMLAKNSPVLKILNEKVDVLNLTPTEKKLYESRMILKSDIVSISNSQFKKGREEGFLTTAKRMKKANFDVSVIQKITGLSKEEIENIKM